MELQNGEFLIFCFWAINLENCSRGFAYFYMSQKCGFGVN